MVMIMKTLCFSFVILASFATLFTVSDAWRFNVGGNGAWVVNPQENYNTWAERNRFQVNDTLYFKYAKGADSVQQVMKSDFDGCNVGNPLKKFDNGESEVTLGRSGPFYFISGNQDHCKKGQKLIVVVLAVRQHAKVPISPAKPPSTVATPAKSPSTSQPPKSSISPASSPTKAQPPKSSSPVSHSPSVSPLHAPTVSPSPKSPSPAASPSHAPKVSPSPKSASPTSSPSHAPKVSPSPKSPSPTSSPSHAPKVSPSPKSPSHAPKVSPVTPSPSPKSPSPPSPSPVSPAPEDDTSPLSPSPSDTTPTTVNITAPAPSPKSSASAVDVTSVMATLCIAFGVFMFA